MRPPIHKHRARTNGVSLKMRLAASENVRSHKKRSVPITLPKAPWEKKNARDGRP